MRLVAFIFILTPFLVFTQSSLEVSFNKIYIGRNISFTYHKNLNRISFNGGASFHLNRQPVPLSSLLKNGANTQTFSQHFGIQIGIDWSLFKNEYMKIGLYYSNQIASINHIIRFYSAVGTLVPEPSSEEDILYSYTEIKFGPVFTTDNVIGLYLEANLGNNFYLSTRFGGGFIYWKNYDNSIIHFAGKKPNQGMIVSSQFSLGLGYTFIKK